MGLFNKTRQIEAVNSQPETLSDLSKAKKSNTGLLGRAEKSKQQTTQTKRSGLLERAASALTKKNGLLERASSALQSQTQKRGLFDRASEIGTKLSDDGLLRQGSNVAAENVLDELDSPSIDVLDELDSPSIDVLDELDSPSIDVLDELDSPSIDVLNELDSPSIDVLDELDSPSIDVLDELDSPSIDVLGELDSPSIDVLDELDSPSIDVIGELDSPSIDVLGELDSPSIDVLDELDFEFEEKSPIEDDPAINITEADQIHPFDDWQEEAAALAERQARYHIGSDDGDLGFHSDEISTTPVEMHIGSQKRIDNYLALFELNRELNTIDDAEDFFDTALYSVLGQLGARNVIIFAEQPDHDNQVLYPVAYTGVTPADDWNLNSTGALYQSLSKSDEIRYSGEFLKEGFGLADLERTIFEKSKASLLLPLRDKKNLLGIIFIGSPLDRADYVIDDLEYLRLLSGNLVGPLQRIRSIAKHQSDTRLLNHQNQLYRSSAEMNSNLQTKKTIDEIYDVTIEYFKKELKVESLSLILLDPSEQVYKIFAGNQISPESLKRFRLPVAGSELIATISNLSGVFNLVDFKDHSEIISSYTGDDLSLMKFYQILPLINLNWLVGFITIHKSEVDWTDDEREIALIAANQLAPVLANCLIVNERETLFRDPFSPLEKRLGHEVQKALEFHSFLSIVDFKVKNVKKLLGANPMSVMTEFFQTVSRTAARGLHQTDYLSRMGPGRFVILLPGRNRKETEILVNRLQIELKQANLLRGSAVAPSYVGDIINFPDDGDTLQKLIARLDQ